MFSAFLSSIQLIRRFNLSLLLLLIVLLLSHSCVLCFIAEKKSSLAVPKRGMSNLCKSQQQKFPLTLIRKPFFLLFLPLGQHIRKLTYTCQPTAKQKVLGSYPVRWKFFCQIIAVLILLLMYVIATKMNAIVTY